MKKLIINKRAISDKDPPIIIGEISANHNNSLQKVFKIIEKAKEIGLEAIKIQTFDLNEMTFNLKKREFFIKNKFANKSWNFRSLHSIYKEARIPFEWHEKIFKKAKSLGITIFSSVFDKKSLELLEKLNCPAYKIASLESLHFPLILEVSKKKKPMIISTGTLSMEEIKKLHNFLKINKITKYALLHCVTSYPSSPKDLNLITIPYIKKKFNCLSGFSDHSLGRSAAIASVSFGANIIEKHFKLSKNDKGLDAQFSLCPQEMEKLISETKNAWQSIGKIKLNIPRSEVLYKKYRRSIYTSNNIKKGEKITNKNIKIIRPGLGLSPMNYFKILGKKVNKTIKFGHAISKKDIA